MIAMNGNKKTIVIPGDFLGYSEEYLPGKNTMEVNSKIISASFGEVVKNDRELVASVDNGIRKIYPKNEDIIYGRIVKNDSRQVSIQIVGIEKSGKVEKYFADGYIRNVQDYKRDERKVQTIHIGDLIRGRIIRIGQNLEITLNGKRLGVLKSRCSRCSEVLVLKNGALFCENCNRSEMRKIAPDYSAPEFVEMER